MKIVETNPLDRIVFLSVPNDLQKTLGSFVLDPSILLPVEIEDGDVNLDPSKLSWEQIISAMLKILCYDKTHKDTEYYRSFILAIRPDIEKELTAAGIAKAEQHEFDLAEELFGAISALLPEKSRHSLNLALVCEQRAQTFRKLERFELADEYEEKAAKQYTLAMSLEDTPAEAFLYAGHFHFRQNDIERARELFKHFLLQAPNHDEAPAVKKLVQELEVSTLGDTLFKEAFDFIRMGQEEKGLERLETFMQRNSEVWNAHFMKGWAYRRLAKYTEAIPCFTEAIQLGGSNVDTLNELAICLMEVGEFAASSRALTEALKMEPENTKIMANMGILALKEGKTLEAKRFFETVLVYDEEDPVAKAYLGNLK